MAQQSERWHSAIAISSNEALDLGARLAASRRIGIAQRSSQRLLLKAGSQASLRLKGGWIAKIEDFPVEIEINVISLGDAECDVTVDVRDSLGFGFKAGMKNKYQQAVSMWMTDFRQLYAPLTTARASTEASSTSLSAELESLRKLHQDGSLNDDEFQAAKAKLLGT